MTEDPQPLKRRNDWLKISAPYRMAARRSAQKPAFKDTNQASRHLEIPEVAGGMERNQDVVG
jgi:hypothetical protein